MRTAIRTTFCAVCVLSAIATVVPADGSVFRTPGLTCDIPLLIDFDDAELRRVLEAFAKASGFEFVVALGVDLDRRVTISLSGLSASVAMATALEQVGLDLERCGPSIIVRPAKPLPEDAVISQGGRLTQFCS